MNASLQPASVGKIALALLTVYLIWGSTYLAIRFGVAVTPPYLFAATRFVAAGLILLVYARATGLALPTSRADWKVITITAILLLVGANGLVTWSEQWVESNQAALMVATSALWMAGFGTLGARGERQSMLTWAGLLVGFLGVAVLVGEGLLHKSAPTGAYVALVISPILWAAGSIYGRRNPQQCAPLMTAALQMLIAGVLMAGVGFASGEHERWRWTAQSWGAWAYLTVLGSCIAYGAYYWLVHNVTPALLGTYAYVNPAIAVLLGAWLGAEHLSGMQMIGTGVILGGVIAVTLGQRMPMRKTADQTT
ncbi:MAG: EamA family transporter [Stagnimonas sp.]|nr:EamA family transporter [Stagnimonas sp.]